MIPQIFHSIPYIYAVGGAVRDLYMGLKPHDIDLASPLRPEQILEWAEHHNIHAIPTGIDHGTITLVHENVHYEHTTFRADVSCDGRNATVAFSFNIEDDLARRDFTCNAMAIHKNGRIYDPYYGRIDINNKVLKTVGKPIERFGEDYLRIIRAARFAARFGWNIDQDLVVAAKTLAHKIPLHVSNERIYDEFNKAFKYDKAGDFLNWLYNFLVIDYIIPEYKDSHKIMQNPEFHPEGDLWSHLCEVVEACWPEYRWNALFHDIGKPSTATLNEKGYFNFYGHAKAGADLIPDIAKRMKWPNSLAESVERTTLLHLYPLDIRGNNYAKDFVFPDRAIRKLRVKAGAHFNALHAVCKADCGKNFEHECGDLFNRTTLDPIQPVLMGRHLLDAGVKAGKEMGAMLAKAFEIQIDEGISDVDELLRRVLNPC